MDVQNDQTSDEQITMLMSMGFMDIEAIRRALVLCKNDLNDAVSILTGEDTRGGFGELPADVEMNEVCAQEANGNKSVSPKADSGSGCEGQLQYGPLPAPSSSSPAEESLNEEAESIEVELGEILEEFPVTNLYELEDRVFTDSWSIPYKKDESLGKCLIGAIKLAYLKKTEEDANCKRFMDRTLPECCQKLLTSQAVRKWTSEIHDGVFNMIKLFIDLAASRLQYDPVPVKILPLLALAFDPETEFHFKNRSKRWNRAYYEDLFGYEKCPAVSPAYNTYLDPYGWLVDLVNRFAIKGGFDAVVNRVSSSDCLSASTLAALLQPFGCCAAYLNPEVAGYQLGGVADKVVHYIRDMKAEDMKAKEVDKVYDLLRTLRTICQTLWPDKSSAIDDLHLDTILNMLKTRHFNARMNALKELSRVIREAEKHDQKWNGGTHQDAILKWLLGNKVLSIAFESSLHQSQYCDKLKKVVEFAGVQLSLDELTTIWGMQVGKHPTVVDNIHAIIASASQSFSCEQLEHLIVLLKKSWQEEDEKSKECLLLLIGKIGRDIKDSKIVAKLLDMLWDFSHEKGLPLYLLNQSVQSHLDILTESSSIRPGMQMEYVVKCIDDVKLGKWVVPAIRHMLKNLEGATKSSHAKTSQNLLQDLQKQHDVMKLACQSLAQAHNLAVAAIPPNTLDGETVIGDMYTYAETVMTHLKFVEFVLQCGGLCLSWSRCKEIWDCLMLDGQNCDGDYETCLEWFSSCITDLQADTQAELFRSRILKTDVKKMKEAGLKCFKQYFKAVNANENKMSKKTGPVQTVDKQDLTGLPYLWQLVLESPYSNVAEDAAQYLVQVSYTALNPKLKKAEFASIHRKFMGECFKRLELLMQQLKDCDDLSTEGKTSKFKKPLPVKHPNNDRSQLLVSTERVLMLAHYYIVTIEDGYVLPRTYPPHGSCFHGSPITVHVSCESSKTEFDLASHTNEVLKLLRSKIGSRLGASPEHVQINMGDQLLADSKDHKLLSDLGFEDRQNIIAKVVTAAVAAGSVSVSALEDELSPLSKPSSLLEREKSLPSYVLAFELKIFPRLYQLAELEHPPMTTALRNLLNQLPTDGDVLNAIDVFSFQNPLSCSPGTRAGYASKSSSVIETYFKCSAPKMSTFRVLYNLQVLSSRLMPVLDSDSAMVTQSFRENWLNAGGLSLIINILQPDTLPSSASYNIRQSCYFIILQLARFLLCGESSYEENLLQVNPVRTYGHSTTGGATTSNIGMLTVSSCQSESSQSEASMATSTPIKLPRSPGKAANCSSASSWPGTKALGGSPHCSQVSSSPGSSCVTPENASEPKRLRSASVLDQVSPTVRMVIETMNEQEFSETIVNLVQVSWAAAAGQLQLNAHHYLKSDVQLPQDASNSQDELELKAGLCLRQEKISALDAELAVNALELLVVCLQLRPSLIRTFYGLPHLSEFIIDILTGSPCDQVRKAAAQQLTLLSETVVVEPGSQPLRDSLLQVLMKASLPVWTPSGTVRGVAFKIFDQCLEFFELLCNLLTGLTKQEQNQLNICPVSLLQNELAFLGSADNVGATLLLGHLKLINALCSCEGVDKRQIGLDFTSFIIDDFLFAASKVASSNLALSTFDISDLNSSCMDPACRKEAFSVLVNLASNCAENLCDMASKLVSKHHNQLNSKEWNFQPAVSPRPANGFVGLKNAGATCYMNSIIQQLYMQPGIREALLKVDDDKLSSKESVFQQMQAIFAHLLESHIQFYTPEKFWRVFKLWGEPVNVREQQDAFEFFINITDQMDEHLKGLHMEEVFKKTFSGMFVDQKICKECSHRFERDEPFFSLPVTVKCGSLEASLEQFVHNEVMEGDNAYYCEKCCERRTTVKRTCIKSLPPVLVIQLKRFWYDWEKSRAIKFDDFFSFPWVLDMEPYTSDGIVKKEKEAAKKDREPEKENPFHIITDTHYYYELVGVVVHVGQANAGHYYSFIKNRQNHVGHWHCWYKFNDVSVEKFEMTDEALETECFGGEYKVPQTDSSSQYPENRIRNWNGYLLFYETMDKNRLPPSATITIQDPRGQLVGDVCRSYPASPASSSSNPPSPASRDQLSQLSALVRRGERKGLFTESMPANIKRLVNEANIQFIQNRDVYNEDYFEFVRSLCSLQASMPAFELSEKSEASVVCLQLAIKFLFNTYFHTDTKVRSHLSKWTELVESLLDRSRDGCLWLLDLLAADQGSDYLGPYLLECPDKGLREAFGKIMLSACRFYVQWTPEDRQVLDKLVTRLLFLLDKEVGTHVKNCGQYFGFFYDLSFMDALSLSCMVQRHCFRRFTYFLLGPAQSSNHDNIIRRWSAQHAQEFTTLHKSLVLFVLNCDNKHVRTASTESSQPYPRSISQLPVLLTLPSDIEDGVYGDEGERYMHECLFACIELPHLNQMFSDMFVHCCWCNMQYSKQAIRQILAFLAKAQVNDMKHLFPILSSVLEIHDPHQGDRIKLCIDGSEDLKLSGLLKLISSTHNPDPRRAYQIIKFVVGMGNKLLVIKEHLLSNSSKWSWAVDWLKKKLSECFWTAQPHITNDNHTSFQRTVSAQNTLAEATKLLTELEGRDSQQEGASSASTSAIMDTSSNIEEVPEDESA